MGRTAEDDPRDEERWQDKWYAAEKDPFLRLDLYANECFEKECQDICFLEHGIRKERTGSYWQVGAGHKRKASTSKIGAVNEKMSDRNLLTRIGAGPLANPPVRDGWACPGERSIKCDTQERTIRLVQ